MTDQIKTPLHLWIVAVLSTLWHLMGANDYVMTQFRVEGYLANMTELQMQWIDGFPAWATSFWALSIWTAVLGSLLLFMRSRHSKPLFIVSLIAYFGTCLWTYVLSPIPAMEISGLFGIIFTTVIAVVVILMIYYTDRMIKSGVLR